MSDQHTAPADNAPQPLAYEDLALAEYLALRDELTTTRSALAEAQHELRAATDAAQIREEAGMAADSRESARAMRTAATASRNAAAARRLTDFRRAWAKTGTDRGLRIPFNGYLMRRRTFARLHALFALVDLPLNRHARRVLWCWVYLPDHQPTADLG